MGLLQLDSSIGGGDWHPHGKHFALVTTKGLSILNWNLCSVILSVNLKLNILKCYDDVSEAQSMLSMMENEPEVWLRARLASMLQGYIWNGDGLIFQVI